MPILHRRLSPKFLESRSLSVRYIIGEHRKDDGIYMPRTDSQLGLEYPSCAE